MAINKRKILQSAQKNMQKGALDKALKDYTTLLEADPTDANVRLKVGDIHLKQGKTEEAVSSYLKVAQRFMKDGFDAKAVALYKQVTKIDPKRYDIYVPLSELYQRLGLSSDAMQALQTAADAHYREGDKNQALDLLRKMATVDPSNTTNRLKVAELLRHEGRQAEALAEYDEVAEELERQGDTEGRAKVLQQILDIDPTRMATFLALGNALIEQRNWSQAKAAAEMMIEAFPTEAEGYELLADVCQHSGRDSDLPDVYRRLAEVYKARGDEDRAREIMQRFVSTESLGSEENGDSDLLTDEALSIDAGIGADGTLGMSAEEFEDSGLISSDSLRLGDPIGVMAGDEAARDAEANETSSHSLPPLPPLETEPATAADLEAPEGDPDQLFAEATVYIRYGKHERAIASLRAILSQDPSHRAALEKLGEALVASGDEANAVTAFSRAAESARDEGDDTAFETLRARVEAIDPAAATALVPAAPTPPSEPEHEVDAPAAPERDAHLDDIDVEIDPDIDAADSEIAVDSDESIDFEIEDDFGFEESSTADEEVAVGSLEGGESTAASDDVELDIDIGEASFESREGAGDDDETEAQAHEDAEAGVEDASLDDTPAIGALVGSPSASSATTPQQIVEDLEEADFYFQQELYDEAEEIYQRIVRSAPNHPQAMLRLGEIEAARAEPERAASAAAGEPTPVGAIQQAPLDAASDPESDAEHEPIPDTPKPQVRPEVDFGMELTDPAMLDLEDEEDFDLDTPEECPQEQAPAAPEAPVLQVDETTASIGETTARMDGEADESGESRESGDFDLAAELSGALDGEQSGAFPTGLAGTTEEEGFEQVFAAFKQGVQQELGEGDFEARYDLGIAYKEMGLLEDAIGEFQIALGSPARKLAALHAMGLCALDLSRLADAVSHFEQALALPEVPTEQQIALHFDLGRAYEEQGALERARSAYEVVSAVDPDFGAVGERIAMLERGERSDGTERLASEAKEEALESFDDLVDGIEPDAVSEQFESFDDLISESGDVGSAEAGECEAEAPPGPVAAEIETEPEPVPAEVESAPEPVPAEIEAESLPEPTRQPSEPKKPGRRKKISFV